MNQLDRMRGKKHGSQNPKPAVNDQAINLGVTTQHPLKNCNPTQDQLPLTAISSTSQVPKPTSIHSPKRVTALTLLVGLIGLLGPEPSPKLAEIASSSEIHLPQPNYQQDRGSQPAEPLAIGGSKSSIYRFFDPTSSSPKPSSSPSPGLDLEFSRESSSSQFSTTIIDKHPQTADHPNASNDTQLSLSLRPIPLLTLPPLKVQPTPPPAPRSQAAFVWPVTGQVSSGYGWRRGRFHAGIDIAGPMGSPIVAVKEGTVTFSGYSRGGYGNRVDIRHQDGTLTRYAHGNRIYVQHGEWVQQGQTIMSRGSTGWSTGPHLHFEIRPHGGQPVNPMPYLN